MQNTKGTSDSAYPGTRGISELFIHRRITTTLVMIGIVLFGLIGYLFKKFGYDGAPLTLAFVLGPLLELNLKQSLLLSRGSFLIFITRPISAIFIFVAAMLFLTSLLSYVLRLEKLKRVMTN